MPNRHLTHLLILLVVLSAPSARPAAAQVPAPVQAPTPVPVRIDLDILAIGGFLGQWDGFCEYPGGSYDLPWWETKAAQPCPAADGRTIPENGRRAFGGLLGAKSWVQAKRVKLPQSLLIVAGNNQLPNFASLGGRALAATAPAQREQPQSRTDTRVQQAQRKVVDFWADLRSLSPTAIGLGPEDLVRSLRPLDGLDGSGPTPSDDPASVFVHWVSQITAGEPRLPLIASNIVIRARNRGAGDLNTLKKDKVSLQGMEDDSSTDWLSAVTIGHPAASHLSFELCDHGPLDRITGDPACEAPARPADADATTTEVTPAAGSLLPGHAYEVRVTDVSGARHEPLLFRTHQALTPHDQPAAYLNGFPVVVTGKAGDSADVIVMSLIDPSVKAVLGSEAWKWRGEGCGADECEIDVTSPSEALDTLFKRAIAAHRPKPLIILVSSLNDATTLELLESHPEIRAVVLPPDSLLLGRAARTPTTDKDDAIGKAYEPQSAGQRYSGDLGFTSVVNGTEPAATLLMARPEWIGETGAQLHAEATFERGEWFLDREAAVVESIAGAALRWEIGPCGYTDVARPCVFYKMTWNGQEFSHGGYEQYADCRAGNITDRCAVLRSLATDADQFQTFAGDALRQSVRTELAVVPDDLLDYDVGGWLVELLTGAPPPSAEFLSRLVLERGIYRSVRYVRAAIPGDKLVETLDKILKSDVLGGGCLTGVRGSACVATVNAKQPETVWVNGRPVDSRLYYTVAVPDRIAEALDLDHRDNEVEGRDALTVLHRLLLGPDWYVAAPSGPLSQRLLDRGRKRVRSNLIVSALEFGFTESLLPGLNNREGTLKGLDVEFRSVSASNNLSTKGTMDFAVLDTSWVSLRAVGNLDFSRRTDMVKKTRDVTYSSNSWLAGGRVDLWKPVMLNHEYRPFVGRFAEGELEREPQYFTATFSQTAGGTKATTSALSATPFHQEPLRFDYWAVGVDTMNAFKLRPFGWLPVDITRLGAMYARGTVKNVPVGIDVGGVPQDKAAFDMFLTQGAGAVLNDYFEKHVATFDPAVGFSARPGEQRQGRVQLDADVEPRFTKGKRTYKLGAELRYRRYLDVPQDVSLALLQSWRVKLKLTIPLVWRFELVPNVEFHRARIHTTNANLDDLFRYRKIEATIRLPFVVRAGWGWLFR